MRRRPAPFIGVIVLAVSLTACATPAESHPESPPTTEAETTMPGVASSPTGTPVQGAAERAGIDARTQAQKWLASAALPPGAVRASANAGRFDFFESWPCGPVETLEGFWMIPHTTVAVATNWIRQHPTANLVSTTPGPVSGEEAVTSAMAGYIPEPGPQEGIVFGLVQSGDGVAVRAQIAALDTGATCPILPDGGQWGAPGQG